MGAAHPDVDKVPDMSKASGTADAKAAADAEPGWVEEEHATHGVASRALKAYVSFLAARPRLVLLVWACVAGARAQT